MLIEIQSLNTWVPVTLRYDHSFAPNDMWKQFTLILREAVGLLIEIGPLLIEIRICCEDYGTDFFQRNEFLSTAIFYQHDGMIILKTN